MKKLIMFIAILTGTIFTKLAAQDTIRNLYPHHSVAISLFDIKANSYFISYNKKPLYIPVASIEYQHMFNNKKGIRVTLQRPYSTTISISENNKTAYNSYSYISIGYVCYPVNIKKISLFHAFEINYSYIEEYDADWHKYENVVGANINFGLYYHINHHIAIGAETGFYFLANFSKKITGKGYYISIDYSMQNIFRTLNLRFYL